MIDDPDQVERLLAKLRAALPLPARMTPRLLAAVQDQVQVPGTRQAAARLCAIARAVPRQGKVHVLTVTDRQFV